MVGCSEAEKAGVDANLFPPRWAPLAKWWALFPGVDPPVAPVPEALVAEARAAEARAAEAPLSRRRLKDRSRDECFKENRDGLLQAAIARKDEHRFKARSKHVAVKLIGLVEWNAMTPEQQAPWWLRDACYSDRSLLARTLPGSWLVLESDWADGEK